MNAFAADEEAFASKAVFVEMRLRQALSSSVSLGVLERASNLIWTSASCMLTTAPSPCMHMLTTAPSVEPSNGPPPCMHVLTTAPCPSPQVAAPGEPLPDDTDAPAFIKQEATRILRRLLQKLVAL
jgi:hypothetical protein